MDRSLRRLPFHERDAFARHLLALHAEDRWLRFGAAKSDAAIREYVANIDFDRDAVFGVFGDAAELVAAAHLAHGPGHAEIGLSVLPGYRRRGLGSALVEACCAQARRWGVRSIFMRCAAENAAMCNLARAHGMRVIVEGPEADALLALPDTGGTAPFAPATV